MNLDESGPTQVYVPPAFIGSASRWGLVDDYAYWQAVFALYDQDNIEGAYVLALQLGAGRSGSNLRGFRNIEAEYGSYMRSEDFEIAPWLTLTYIPNETGDLHMLVSDIQDAVDQVDKRFKWDNRETVRVQIFAEEYAMEWLSNYSGYCSQKAPYYKICLHNYVTQDPDRLKQIFKHEFAHVISMSLTKARLPNWLGEGFSVLASDEFHPSTRARYLRDQHLWVDALTLDKRIKSFSLEEDQLFERWLAYQQSGWIVRYLSTTSGDWKLIECLGQFADESFWRNMKFLVGVDRTADAIKAVYGLDLKELFEKSFDWMIATTF